MDRPEYTRRVDFDELQYEQLVQAGIAALKGGERQQARSLLFKAAEMKPTDPNVWLWLSATTDDPDEQRDGDVGHTIDPHQGLERRGNVHEGDAQVKTQQEGKNNFTVDREQLFQ